MFVRNHEYYGNFRLHEQRREYYERMRGHRGPEHRRGIWDRFRDWGRGVFDRNHNGRIDPGDFGFRGRPVYRGFEALHTPVPHFRR